MWKTEFQDRFPRALPKRCEWRGTAAGRLVSAALANRERGERPLGSEQACSRCMPAIDCKIPEDTLGTPQIVVRTLRVIWFKRRKAHTASDLAPTLAPDGEGRRSMGCNEIDRLNSAPR